jgi:hypothetical protein
MGHPIKGQLKACVRQTLRMESVCNTRLYQGIHGSLLQHACANTPFDIRAILAIKDDCVDTGFAKQLRKQ